MLSRGMCSADSLMLHGRPLSYPQLPREYGWSADTQSTRGRYAEDGQPDGRRWRRREGRLLRERPQSADLWATTADRLQRIADGLPDPDAGEAGVLDRPGPIRWPQPRQGHEAAGIG